MVRRHPRANFSFEANRNWLSRLGYDSILFNSWIKFNGTSVPVYLSLSFICLLFSCVLKSNLSIDSSPQQRHWNNADTNPLPLHFLCSNIHKSDWSPLPSPKAIGSSTIIIIIIINRNNIKLFANWRLPLLCGVSGGWGQGKKSQTFKLPWADHERCSGYNKPLSHTTNYERTQADYDQIVVVVVVVGGSLLSLVWHWCLVGKQKWPFQMMCFSSGLSDLPVTLLTLFQLKVSIFGDNWARKQEFINPGIH